MIPLTLEFDEREIKAFQESDALKLLTDDCSWLQQQIYRHPPKGYYYIQLYLRPVVWN